MIGKTSSIALTAAIALTATFVWAQGSRTTSIIGLTKVTIEGHVIDCHLARPAGEGTWPGLVLAHDRMGVDVEMKRLADRLAAEGFYVMMPDLFQGRVALDADKGRELAAVLDENEAVLTLAAVAGHLKYLPEVGNHRVGLVGFDMGGRLALLTATRSVDVSAVAIVDGRPITEIDSLRRVNVPIMAVFGERDDQVTPADVKAFKEAMDKAGRTSIVKSIPDAGHGFMKPGGETFKQAAVDEAWPALIAFLKEAL